MISFRVPVILSYLRLKTSPFHLQRRWARVHDIRLVAASHSSDSILDRYKEKLDQKAREEGHESIDSLKQAYRDRISALRRKASAIPAASSLALQSGSQQPTLSASKSQPAEPGSIPSPISSTPGIKPLSAYLDLAKIATLPPKELEYIWRLRHASDSLSLCAVIPIEIYRRIYRIAQNHPQFILPLPRPVADDGSGDAKQAVQGFEGGPRTTADIHFLQWNFHPPAVPPSSDVATANTHTSTVMFTYLASFKIHGAYAQPHTTITHHLDLVDSHGLVLLNGAVKDGRGVSAEEARWLVMCLQKFYDFEGHGGGVGKEKRQGLLEKFSRGDQGFDLGELVEEAERVS